LQFFEYAYKWKMHFLDSSNSSPSCTHTHTHKASQPWWKCHMQYLLLFISRNQQSLLIFNVYRGDSEVKSDMFWNSTVIRRMRAMFGDAEKWKAFFKFLSNMSQLCKSMYIFFEYTIMQQHHQWLTTVTSFDLLLRPSSDHESQSKLKKHHTIILMQKSDEIWCRRLQHSPERGNGHWLLKFISQCVTSFYETQGLSRSQCEQVDSLIFQSRSEQGKDASLCESLWSQQAVKRRKQFSPAMYTEW
jgi:hypothetical protein